MTTPSRARHGPEASRGRWSVVVRAGRVARAGPVSTDAATHRLARTGAAVCLVVILLAVLWPSGGDVAQAKSILGLWFLSEADKDVVLNLVMLAPLTFLGTLGWPRVPWWAWALLGCALGASAELTQLLVTALDRRASWANVGQNAAA